MGFYGPAVMTLGEGVGGWGVIAWWDNSMRVRDAARLGWKEVSRAHTHSRAIKNRWR